MPFGIKFEIAATGVLTVAPETRRYAAVAEGASLALAVGRWQG